MMKVGLTGGIGSGKSTVSAIFKEIGFQIIDADLIAREVLSLFPEILEKVVQEFGEGFLDEESQLKRREFGNFIFKYPMERRKYEDIIIPYIKKRIFTLIKEYEDLGEEIIILDAPTLIETSLHKQMDYNILVYVDKETQIRRIKERDNMSYNDILARINSQMSLEEKIEEVNFVINNTESIEETKDQVMEIASFFNTCK
ncbi:dephospho-CoA kinase [Clostridium sp.]|uniref:dephospho-CoA kinase n=1 Tax=Clostridium sp. TaxID=1506 RepID=UPI0034646F80